MIAIKNLNNVESAAFRFISIKNVHQLSLLLDINPDEMYSMAADPEYRKFSIPKKRGGYREITVPGEQLQQLQKRINFYLQSVYSRIMPDCVHGFVKADPAQASPRNIVTNASVHTNKKYVLNIDLKDFFPSITSSRVRKMFMAVFDFDKELATCLTLLTTYQSSLPVGAPTSPDISNLVAIGLDLKLDALAKSHRILYSRYADDMTFSADFKIEKEIYNDILYFINDAGFQINEQKVRQQSSHGRQTVTGIIVNEKPNINRKYIRNIRAILHHWKQNGIDAAWERYFINPFNHHVSGVESFMKAISGKIEFIGTVRGKDDQVFRKLKNKFEKLTMPQL